MIFNTCHIHNIIDTVKEEDDAPGYLGIKLDRSLTFNQHLEGVKNKLKTGNNIISKLSGTG